jgi:sterol 3beta-glucosyltransferase
VRLVTHENFETLVASHGLEFWPVAGSEQDIVQGADLVPEARAQAQQRAVILSGWSGLQVAGLPSSVVIPLFADQRFWDWRVAEWGVGPAPIPRRRLTAEQLARAIESAVRDPIMRRRAADLGAESRAEDGIARAVAVVRQIEK